MSFFRSSSPQRLFILGLDGSPLWLLRKFMDSGDMPNLARIFESGSAVEMDSSLPDVSAVAWTSVNTGKNPAKHGIYGFVDRKPGTNEIEVMTSAHVKAKTIWELVSETGRRVVAINVPLSYPPQRVNGVVISDFLAPRLSKAVHPPSYLPALEKMGYRIDTDPWVARQSLDAFLEDFKQTAEKRAEAVLHFLSTEQWQFFMVVFMETDRLHHFLWRYMEEDNPNYGTKFRSAYRQIDEIIGRILSRLSPEDELIVMSDHGFTTLKKEVYLNAWLEEEGYLQFAEGERGLSSIDPRSRAFSLDPGRVYVNLAGREPGGSVSTDEAPRLLDEMTERLVDLKDTDDGASMVLQVLQRDQIYHGPYRDRAPDLLVMPRDGYDIKGTFEYQSLTGRGKLVGMHKYDNATFFVRGHRLSVDHASVRDVLPTACALMGLDAPSDVDGRNLLLGRSLDSGCNAGPPGLSTK